ncbi:stonustoxin subunit beta-like [Colossoma macropomum]|uniref:stonustoxin subunit beta-like n=1 Tax=Colossoma macropomum TaxID=42526 RepID=UPI0018643254|nr:stonustoxin subunit beta-like [Colossoma macropomum]
MLSDLLDDPHYALDTLRVDHGGEIRMKPGLKKYAVDLTLHPNTVNRCLSLSEGNRKVERVFKDHSYPDHPDRFDGMPQVLSVESLTGRCYWELQWSSQRADISVSYRGIRRKGGIFECGFAYNNQFWSLQYFESRHTDNRYSFWHNEKRTYLPIPPSPSKRVGVYLDWESGTLSFYSISPDTHTYCSTYTHSTSHSLSLSMPGLGFMITLCGCVRYNNLLNPAGKIKTPETHYCVCHGRF